MKVILVDQSLAEFEELERNLDRTNYDHIFAEVDDAAADIERIRNREQIFRWVIFELSLKKVIYSMLIYSFNSSVVTGFLQEYP